MFKTSLSHLRRTPMKALLFVLLLAGATMLLVFGAHLLINTTQKIQAVEEQFTTIATVQQVSTGTKNTMNYDKCQGFYSGYQELYADSVPLESLNFEGADYINPPENRPYYLSVIDGKRNTNSTSDCDHFIEFTPLEDQKEADQHIQARVEAVHFEAVNRSGGGPEDHAFEPGEEITICQHYNTVSRRGDYARLMSGAGGQGSRSNDFEPLQAGHRYIAHFMSWSSIATPCQQDPEVYEYVIVDAPYSSQRYPDGRLVESGLLGGKTMYRADEVNDEFYESGMWDAWQRKMDSEEADESLIPIVPTNSLQLLPTFHDKKTYLQNGREITEEEFQSGAKVCMVSFDFASRNLLKVGDMLSASMVYALYGYDPALRFWTFSRPEPLNAEGEYYEPFWEAEYEIVGIYQFYDQESAVDGKFEVTQDCVIVPWASIEASDENNIVEVGPMQADYCSFQIPNGTISEFNEKLYANVPNMSGLTVTYKDNGYTDVMASLKKTQLSAVLLFTVGLLSSVAIVALLLYFFIVREKKRTAIERSLGMSGRQCRISLISGVMVLAILGTVLGSAAGALTLNWEDLTAAPPEAASGEYVEPEKKEYAGFDVSYSLWARTMSTEDDIEVEGASAVDAAVYLGAPGALLAVIILLSVVLVNRSLKIEPILLLSGKTD